MVNELVGWFYSISIKFSRNVNVRSKWSRFSELMNMQTQKMVYFTNLKQWQHYNKHGCLNRFQLMEWAFWYDNTLQDLFKVPLKIASQTMKLTSFFNHSHTEFWCDETHTTVYQVPLVLWYYEYHIRSKRHDRLTENSIQEKFKH